MNIALFLVLVIVLVKLILMLNMESTYYLKKGKFDTKKSFIPESMLFLYDPSKFEGKDIKYIKIQNKLTILAYVSILLGFIIYMLIG